MRSYEQLKGARVISFHRIVVWVGDERFELEDSLLILLEGGVVFQLASDAQQQTFVRLESLSEYVIFGEWGDRTREELVEVSLELTPFDVEQLFAVHEITPDQELLVGLMLASSAGLCCAINANLDDVSVCSPTEFFAYVQKVLPATREIRIRQC